MRRLGTEIETLALEYLERRGFQLICRNYRCRFGEIDLIGCFENVLVFVEVRYRKHDLFGSAAESISLRKQQKIICTAQVFLKQAIEFSKKSCRFDVIAVTLKMRDYIIDWIPNAF